MSSRFKTPLQIAKDVENQARLAVLFEIHVRDNRIKKLEEVILTLDRSIPIKEILRALGDSGKPDLLEEYVEAVTHSMDYRLNSSQD